MNKLQVKQHWQFVVVGLLGAWFAISPWVLNLQDTRNILATGVLLGLALIASAIASLMKPRPPEKWIVAAVGLLTAVAPWLVRFASDHVATRNAEAVGLASLVLAIWALLSGGDIRGRVRDQLARR